MPYPAQYPIRKKCELYWTGLSGVLVAGTTYNLVNVFSAITPTSGSWSPFFNTSTFKMFAFDDDVSLMFKLNLAGTWATTSANCSIQLDFPGTNGNRLVASRDAAVTTDNITLATFFSVDRGGYIATTGTIPTIVSNGRNFTINSALLIAEQVTASGSIRT